MGVSSQIDKFSSRFSSPATEMEYRAFVFDGNYKNNIIVLIIALPLFSLYVFLDIINLQYHTEAVSLRLGAVGVGAVLLLSLRAGVMAKRHEMITAAIIFLLGIVVIYVVWKEPTLDHGYYIGLIQGAVFISCLLRISVSLAASTMGLWFIGFVIAVQGKPQPEEAFLQSFILFTMFSICSFGVYLFERYRRIDFLKTRLIERQNAQLKRMLEDIRLDNARKVAAMNTLVHFVRTPIHQISGFTDVVMNALSQAAEEEGRLPPDCLKSVGYIKSASTELADNVAKLLAYYRLDESAAQGKPAPVPLNEMTRDFRDELSPDVETAVSGEKIEIMSHVEPIRIALRSLADAYNEKAASISRIDITLERAPEGAAIVIVDDGPGHTPEEFRELAKPLTKLDRYLTSDGSAMPMAIRTAARAAEVCGGALTYEPAPGANRLTLRLKDFAADLARAGEPEPASASGDEAGEPAPALPAAGAA